MTLMLHAGAKPVDYDGLRALTTPDATATHVPIPHYRVVDLVKSTLAMYGHDVNGENYGVTEDGARFFGVLSLKSTYGDWEDTVGLRNSHDKRFPIGVGIGSKTFVCDNLAFVSDHVIKRKHTANAKKELPGLIMEIIEPLALLREEQAKKLISYRHTDLTDGRADMAIMQMYRQGVINVTRIADVVEQWDAPVHDWGNKTAWRLFNAATFALNGRVMENADVTPRLHKIIDGTLATVN